jgi:hypothetical protein
MSVHRHTAIPLLAENEPVVGLQIRERERAKAEAGAVLTAVRGAQRKTQHHTEPATEADE